MMRMRMDLITVGGRMRMIRMMKIMKMMKITNMLNRMKLRRAMNT